MKVRIERGSGGDWYRNRIGEEYEVMPTTKTYNSREYFMMIKDGKESTYGILATDCVVVKESVDYLQTQYDQIKEQIKSLTDKLEEISHRIQDATEIKVEDVVPGFKFKDRDDFVSTVIFDHDDTIRVTGLRGNPHRLHWDKFKNAQQFIGVAKNEGWVKA